MGNFMKYSFAVAVIAGLVTSSAIGYSYGKQEQLNPFEKGCLMRGNIYDED